MSRYELAPLDPSQGIEVAIGWDPPLTTFFAIVRAQDDPEDDDEDPIILWLGTAGREIADPSQVIEAVRSYAVIPDGIVEALEADREFQL